MLAIEYLGRWTGFGLALAVSGAAFLMSLRISAAPLKALWPLFAILAVSVVVTLFSESWELTSAFRGGFYFIRIAVFVYAGYTIAKSEKVSARTILLALVFAGLVASLDYIRRFDGDSAISYENREYIRNAIGTGDLLIWLVPCASLVLWRPTKMLQRAFLVAASVIAAYAIYVSTSRTGFLAIGIGVLAIVVPARNLWTLRAATIALVALSLVCFTPLIAWMFGQETLLTEVPSFLSDLVVPSGGGFGAINEQWRGYETWMAFHHAASTTNGLIYGTGLASNVPLGVTINLNGEMFQSVEVFHSGFSFLVTRAGVLGLALYFPLIWGLTGRLADGAKKLTPRTPESGLARLALGSVFILAIGTPAIAGLFNPDSTGAIGAIICGAGLAQLILPKRTA